MSVIILTGKSCSGKDGVRRELEGMGFVNNIKWKKVDISGE
jgi:RNase adaptor protein for sRNA GlmZ degradation